MGEEIKRRKGNDICCVVGCSNTYSNTNKNVRFYSFPNKPWEVERKKRWIASVRRVNPDGTDWVPKKKSLICSEHFVGGEKSNHPDSPAFVPTIFPQRYKKSSTAGNKKSLERFARLKTREKKRIVEETINTNMGLNKTAEDHSDDSNTESLLVSGNMENAESATSNVEKVDFGCQVVIYDEAEERNTFVFEVNQENGSMGTQAYIPKQASLVKILKYKKKSASNLLKDAESQTGDSDKITSDKDNFVIGFNTIRSEHQLSEIGGVTFPVFHLLLQILHLSHNSKLSKENILLLFLMKMKLGISFAALSYFFSIHRTTCSRIFVKVLHILSCKMQNFIFWPSKSTVKLLLPEAFRRNYPNSRVIIDCSEIKSEEPPRADQRIFMYSSYKHSYTVKFLIGISPHGLISYLSNCYGGRSSDGYIVNHSGFLNLLEPGDEILADKGFPHVKTDSNAITVIPPVLHNGRFSEEEVAETYNIASVRIHVERAIQRIKIFNILQKIPTELLPHVNKIVRMCAVLVNMQPPIIKNKDAGSESDVLGVGLETDVAENIEVETEDQEIYMEENSEMEIEIEVE